MLVKCSRCKEFKEWSVDNFQQEKGIPRNPCRDCKRGMDRKYQKNLNDTQRAKKNAKDREYRRLNKLST